MPAAMKTLGERLVTAAADCLLLANLWPFIDGWRHANGGFSPGDDGVGDAFPTAECYTYGGYGRRLRCCLWRCLAIYRENFYFQSSVQNAVGTEKGAWRGIGLEKNLQYQGTKAANSEVKQRKYLL
jgi:hypothetical protein